MLAHVAYRDSKVAVENAVGRHTLMDYRVVPRCIHNIPEIVAVGMSENEARSEGYEPRIGRFPLTVNGMGSILEEGGFMKVVADSRHGNVFGVHILAPGGTELIGEATIAMKLRTAKICLTPCMPILPSLKDL